MAMVTAVRKFHQIGRCTFLKHQARSYLSLPQRGSPHRLWEPAAFTLMVGGVAFTLSGIYTAEVILNRGSAFKFKGRDGLLGKARRLWSETKSENLFITGMVIFNTLVILAWRVPWRGQYRMEQLFSTRVSNRGLLHLVLSNFSHYEWWHLGLNMVALSSFVGSTMYLLRDNICSAKTMAFFTTAGTFSALAGYYNKLFRGIKIGSLGASGAIFAMATLVIINTPDSKVALIFLPFIPFKAATALSGFVALDVIGLIRGWQLFDHAAHLGGVLFAILYNQWLFKAFHRIHTKSASLWLNFRSSSPT